jgi:8-oxo-dGTP pyrophosphatase MutT (NUDIX family)
MQISAGIIITDNNYFFIVHPTGQNHWDLPKGRVDFCFDETMSDAALRELVEETGIQCYNKRDLKDLGMFKYIPGKKDLYLFLIYDKNCLKKINLKECVCDSFHTTKKGYVLPENDKWLFIKWNERENYMTVNMNKVLDQIYSNLK